MLLLQVLIVRANFLSGALDLRLCKELLLLDLTVGPAHQHKRMVHGLQADSLLAVRVMAVRLAHTNVVGVSAA